jgi:hypothetical protein
MFSIGVLSGNPATVRRADMYAVSVDNFHMLFDFHFRSPEVCKQTKGPRQGATVKGYIRLFSLTKLSTH